MCQGKLEVTAASQGTFLVCRYCLIIMFHVYLCYEGRFYVRRVVNLINTAKVNAYIGYKFGKMELLSIHANTNYFKTHYFNAFQEANTYISGTGNMAEM